MNTTGGRCGTGTPSSSASASSSDSRRTSTGWDERRRPARPVSRTGTPWIDLEGLAWADPFQSAAWDYNTAIAREAVERGFDEVQFDYIRFPTDPAPGTSIDDTQYSKPFTETNRVDALKTFLGQARRAVNDAGGFLARQRAVHLAAMKHQLQLQDSTTDTAARIVIDHTVSHLDAELRWLESAAARVAEAGRAPA